MIEGEKEVKRQESYLMLAIWILGLTVIRNLYMKHINPTLQMFGTKQVKNELHEKKRGERPMRHYSRSPLVLFTHPLNKTWISTLELLQEADHPIHPNLIKLAQPAIYSSLLIRTINAQLTISNPNFLANNQSQIGFQVFGDVLALPCWAIAKFYFIDHIWLNPCKLSHPHHDWKSSTQVLDVVKISKGRQHQILHCRILQTSA